MKFTAVVTVKGVDKRYIIHAPSAEQAQLRAEWYYIDMAKKKDIRIEEGDTR